MAITLSGVLGTTTQQQPIALAQGEGATINVPTTSGGAAEDFSSYAVKTCRFCARRRDGTVIVDRLGSFVSGVPQFVINSSDTKDIAPQIAAYDVWVTLDGVPSRIVARSVFQLLETEVDLDAVATTPTSEMMLVGLPAVSAPNVGQVLSVADDSPLTLAWADGGAGGGFGFFDVTKYGAVANGTTDCGPAFQAALDAMRVAKGGVLVIPRAASPYKISTTVVANWGSTEGYDIRVLGPGARILVATGIDDACFVIGNQATFVWDQVKFIGDVSAIDVIDCGGVVVSQGITDVSFVDCRFLGLYSRLTATGIYNIIQSMSCGLHVVRSSFEGCCALSVIRSESTQGFEAISPRFIDYGYDNDVYYSKTPNGVGDWLFAAVTTGQQPIAGAISQRPIYIRDMAADEGATNAIVIAGLGGVAVDRVDIDGLTNLQANTNPSSSVYILNARRVKVKNVAVHTQGTRDWLWLDTVEVAEVENCTRNPANLARINIGASVGTVILRDVEYDSIVGSGTPAQLVIENNGRKQLLPYATGSLPSAASLPNGTMVLDTTVPAVSVVVAGAWKKATLS